MHNLIKHAKCLVKRDNQIKSKKISCHSTYTLIGKHRKVIELSFKTGVDEQVNL